MFHKLTLSPQILFFNDLANNQRRVSSILIKKTILLSAKDLAFQFFVGFRPAFVGFGSSLVRGSEKNSEILQTMRPLTDPIGR